MKHPVQLKRPELNGYDDTKAGNEAACRPRTRLENAKDTLITAGFCFIDHGQGKLQLIPREIQIAESILDKCAIAHHSTNETIAGRERELLVVEEPNTFV